MSREHTVASPAPGFTVIAGGKLTTYRVMAKDAVDFAIGSRATTLPSITHDLPLVGAEGLQVFQRQSRAIAQKYGWSRPRMDHLLHRYGSLLGELIDLVDADPSLAEPLKNADAYIGAEIVYAASHEGALHLDDVLMHRTRLNYEQADKGVGALEEIADLVGPVLGWDDATRSKEIAAYVARAGGRGRRRARSPTTPPPRRSGCAPSTSRRCSGSRATSPVTDVGGMQDTSRSSAG